MIGCDFGHGAAILGVNMAENGDAKNVYNTVKTRNPRTVNYTDRLRRKRAVCSCNWRPVKRTFSTFLERFLRRHVCHTRAAQQREFDPGSDDYVEKLKQRRQLLEFFKMTPYHRRIAK